MGTLHNLTAAGYIEAVLQTSVTAFHMVVRDNAMTNSKKQWLIHQLLEGVLHAVMTQVIGNSPNKAIITTAYLLEVLEYPLTNHLCIPPCFPPTYLLVTGVAFLVLLSFAPGYIPQHLDAPSPVAIHYGLSAISPD